MFAPRHIVCASLMAGLLCAAPAISAQSTTSTAVLSVPRYVSFSSNLENQDRKPAAGAVDVTFRLYAEESGGEPLWSETQRLTLDEAGRFTVTLGANTTGGVPVELFAAQKARWLAMEPDGLPMPDRILLLSVPYAAKAGDAETLGGLPASSFMRAGPGVGAVPAGAPTPDAPIRNAPAGGGTARFLPLWTPDGNTLGDSILYQSGTGATAKIGLNTTTPQADLDIAGSLNVGGLLRLPFQIAATATAGSASQPLVLQASSFSSTTQTPVTAKFQLMAVPKGNNTSSPGAALSLSYGTTTLNATGFSIASNGQITFARGQTFPGALTAVTAGTGLKASTTNGTATLSLDTSFSDGRYAGLATNNVFSGTQVMNAALGIGTVPAAGFGLHVNGSERVENGLSMGGNAQLGVDAPFLPNGHFFVDGNGNVGINQPTPHSALDVVGNVNATGSLTASSLAFGSLTIGSDHAMTAAPHMYFTGYVPGPLSAGVTVNPIIAIPSKPIIITRLTSAGTNTCPGLGSLYFTVYGGGANSSLLGYIALNAYTGTVSVTDSGPLSIPVAAGTPIEGSVSAPNCGPFGTAPSDIPVSIEYIMQ
jgi:hypothetical protein